MIVPELPMSAWAVFPLGSKYGEQRYVGVCTGSMTLHLTAAEARKLARMLTGVADAIEPITTPSDTTEEA